VQSASVHAFHVGIGISATFVAGLLGLAGIRNPRRIVLCEDCAGGQLAGRPIDAGRSPIIPQRKLTRTGIPETKASVTSVTTTTATTPSPP
jgi:hypothetical protein